MRPSQNSGHLVTCFHPVETRVPTGIFSSTCNSQLGFCWGKKWLSFQFLLQWKNGSFFIFPSHPENWWRWVGWFWESRSPRSSSLPTSNVNPRSTSSKKVFSPSFWKYEGSSWKYEGSIWRILQIPTVFWWIFGCPGIWGNSYVSYDLLWAFEALTMALASAATKITRVPHESNPQMLGRDIWTWPQY